MTPNQSSLTLIREALPVCRYFLLNHGEHDGNCTALDLDENGCHCECNCGLDKALKMSKEAIAALAEIEQVQAADGVEYDVRCTLCHGSRLEPMDNNYSCSICSGTGFVQKVLSQHPPAGAAVSKGVVPESQLVKMLSLLNVIVGCDGRQGRCANGDMLAHDIRMLFTSTQPASNAQETVGIQACRQGDRDMLATDAGAELVKCVTEALQSPAPVSQQEVVAWLNPNEADSDKAFRFNAKEVPPSFSVPLTRLPAQEEKKGGV
jgi:hypothetical protein